MSLPLEPLGISVIIWHNVFVSYALILFSLCIGLYIILIKGDRVLDIMSDGVAMMQAFHVYLMTITTMLYLYDCDLFL